MDDINELIKTNTIVLDHHKPKGELSNGIHINPHLVEVDGGKEISGAGVAYFFCRELDERIKQIKFKSHHKKH